MPGDRFIVRIHSVEVSDIVKPEQRSVKGLLDADSCVCGLASAVRAKAKTVVCRDGL
jgi:hypothetical protein